tara:strand:- start:592 stop:927 length:336 start_codon:yes stop_codon:yes gene_type:complete
VTQQSYGIKVSTILNAADTLGDDLDYLCSLVERADPEFQISDALSYAFAVVALSEELEFIVEDLAANDLSEDETYTKLSEEELVMLTTYTNNSEEALRRLEEACGISLQRN